MTFVVLGDVMVDVVATATVPLARGSDAPARVRASGGGAGGNVAAWLAAGGTAVVLLARVGDDAAGAEQVTALRAAGVDVRAQVDPALPTGTCVTVVEPDGERTFLPDRAANAMLDAAVVPPDVFRAGGHLHLSGYALLDDAPARAAAVEALRRARAAGMSTSVDPASSGPLRAVGPGRFFDWVRGVDVLLPNADEASALSGEADPAAAAAALRRLADVRAVVVTLGAEGALWCGAEGVVRVAAVPVAGADTTGAGDAFAAAFLAAWRAGVEPGAALAAGVAQGSLAAGRPGARPGSG